MVWLWAWWHRQRAKEQLPDLRFRLYTRRGCHLCEDAWQILDEQRRRYGFVLEAVDVDTDPDLTAHFGERVPVVTVNGKERFRGGVAPALLERLLRGEAARVKG
jgi:glutaredoxin